MSLQILFGDDEHTAVDGPYPRLMKTRKWIYISGAMIAVLTSGLYRPEAAASLLKVLSLPTMLLASAAGIGLAYMVTQYALLLGQLIVSYDLVLGERLSFRRSEELALAKARVKAARDEFEKNFQQGLDRLNDSILKTRSAVATARKEKNERELEAKRLDYESSSTIALKRAQVAERLETLERAIRGV